MANRKKGKSFWEEEIFGYKPTTIILACLVLLLMGGIVANHYGYFDNMTVNPDNNSPKTDSSLKLEKEFNYMMINGTKVADDTANYNNESGVIAVQLDAEQTNNSTHTTFVIKTSDLNGVSKTVASSSQTGVLSTPTTPVTVPVTIEYDVRWTDGFTSTNQILGSFVNASATSLKTADGEKYSPVALKNDKPAVYVNDVLGAKNITWTSSDDGKKIVVSFDLDWEGIQKMTSISDEVRVPIYFTNTNSPEETVRMIKNSAL